MASRKTAGAAAKKQTESEPTQAVTANEPEDAQTEPVQEAPAREPGKEKEPPAPAGRYETFEATRPDKVRVRITRNLDTGEQQVDEL